MTEPPKPPKPASNLYERIHARFAPLGGADDLVIPPRKSARNPRWVAFDRTLTEARSQFADLPPEEAEALIDEAVAAGIPVRLRTPPRWGTARTRHELRSKVSYPR